MTHPNLGILIQYPSTLNVSFESIEGRGLTLLAFEVRKASWCLILPGLLELRQLPLFCHGEEVFQCCAQVRKHLFRSPFCHIQYLRGVWVASITFAHDEAKGSYCVTLAVTRHQDGYAVSVVHPNHIVNYAKSLPIVPRRMRVMPTC